MPSVTVIIPAYNEATRIAAVLDVVHQASLVSDILVVDDGSHDATADVARAAGIHVIRLPENCGKGTAMRTGAIAAKSELILFLDADLKGLTPAQVDAIILPVFKRQAEMSIGVFRGGRTATDLAQVISPHLSGQRCLSRDFFLSIPLLEGSRSGVEIGMTVFARACKVAIAVVPLEGATHTMKEEKMGVVRGAFARWRMYAEILATLVRYRVALRFPGRAPVGTD